MLSLKELQAKSQELGIDKEQVKTFGNLSKKTTWEAAIAAKKAEPKIEEVKTVEDLLESTTVEFVYIPSEKDFAASIASCESIEEIKEKCQKLVSQLEEKYAVGTVRKNLTRYRSVIYTLHNYYKIKPELLKARTVKNKETQKEEILTQSIASDFLKVSEDTAKEIQKQSEEKVYKRANDDTVIDCQKVLDVAEYLLESDNEVELALGIQCFTGRRISEVFLGQFIADDSLTMIFKGQLKNRDSEKALSDYLIPVLFNSPKLEKATANLQNFSNVKSLWKKDNPADFADNRFNRRVRKTFHAYFGQYFPRSHNSKEGNGSSHQLRAFYASVLGENYAKTAGKIDYLAKALGDTVAQVPSYFRFDLKNIPEIELQLTLEEIGMITTTKKVSSQPIFDMEKLIRLLCPEGLLKYNEELQRGKTLEQIFAKAMNKSSVESPALKPTEAIKIDQLTLAFETMVRYNHQCPEGQQIRIEDTSLGNVYTKIAGGKRMFIDKIKNFTKDKKQVIDTHHNDLNIPENQNHRLRKFGMSNIIDNIAKLIILNE